MELNPKKKKRWGMKKFLHEFNLKIEWLGSEII